ncbi:DNA-directed RNA polymerase subunit beta' [Candidatus Wolfebacteria bacterium]|nr:DNA-directed RNA polymerase subunit beta' [Candidatus Wolfebacteria bacterium]
MMEYKDFSGLKLKVASPEEILNWSHGEVIKPETINYRTQRPEKDGLFSERIFGPTKDYECYCGKYRRIRYKGITCDKCGVEVTHSSVRRERMGHIKLAAPVSHIWFLKVIPSRISLFLDIPVQKLEKVIYYMAYIVTLVNEDARKRVLKELGEEFKSKKKETETKAALKELEEKMEETKNQLVSLKAGQILSETEYFNLSRRFGDVFQSQSGADAIRKILENIDLKKIYQETEKELEHAREEGRVKKLMMRLKLAHSFMKNKMKPEWMIISVLPVLPPELRPMVPLDGGRYATSDLNDLYRRVINRNNRLKKLMELKAPEIIVINEKRMLQEAVDALIDNTARGTASPQMSAQRRPLRSLADILKGKQGRFRQNLLGKRVDYSGRSVIVVGPELKLNTCGLPKKMALELFKPFVISKIIKEGLAYTIKNATRLIEQAPAEVWAILEEVIKDKKVLLNRAPTLHRLGIQAFKPVLVEDLAIKIPPMVCSAFNADFDGDQMAVHVPLSKEAQEESEELMLSSRNILKPSTGDPIASPSQDIILGCYYLTKIKEGAKGMGKVFSSSEEAILAYEFGNVDINALVKIWVAKNKYLETSVGRVIFNGVLPEDFGFINEVLNKKGLQRVVAAVIAKYGIENTWKTLDEIKTIGFRYATASGISWGMEDLLVPSEKGKIIEEAEKEISVVEKQYDEGLLTDSERRQRIIAIWEKTKDKIAAIVPKVLGATEKLNAVYYIVDSGARGSWAQAVQMLGMKGLVQNPRGETIELPVKSSYKEGLNVLEFFINTHGSRKGLTDTALKTASAGYLTRRLVDVAQDIIIRENDCRTTEGVEIFRADGDEYGYNFGQRIFSRTLLDDVKVGNKILARAGEIINREKAEKIGKELSVAAVKVRSPLRCKTLYGVCSKCYGLDLGRGGLAQIGEAMGVIAAQSIGEPGTQLTLRTFHTGGIAGVDITHGLPRVEEIFEVRLPKGKAILAESDGIIEDIEERDNMKAILLKVPKNKKSKIIEYLIPRSIKVFVKAKDKISKGDQLCEGSLDLKELFDYKGKDAVERYAINEVQKIYVPEGNAVNDKHIEIIIKQMFSRVMIKEPGDTEFVPGDIAEKSKFLEVNREIKVKGKGPAKAKQLLVGITRASLSTESFLSSASFQETNRILVAAATEGKTDKLRGLKENVIIGRLIPAGTGYRAKPIVEKESKEAESESESE